MIYRIEKDEKKNNDIQMNRKNFMINDKTVKNEGQEDLNELKSIYQTDFVFSKL
jgi:hypothetical protein